MVTIDPESFACPVHHDVDLTPQVLRTLGEGGPPVAFRGLRIGRGPREKPFSVPVTCPGDKPDGEHVQLCVGKYRA